MAEKAVPEVGLADGIVGPVGFFCINKDDARFLVLVICIAPDVVIAVFSMLWMIWVAGSLEPVMLIRGMVWD